MHHHIHIIAYGCLLAFSLAPRLAAADAAYKAVTEGNALYRQQHYSEAAQQYAKAADERPNTPEIDFNLGNAAYKQRDYAKALEHYNRALQTSEPTLESQAKYNLGNVNYQQALQATSNPKQAIEHLQTAMTYYRDSLETVPEQPSARYNLELAHRLLQQLQQQQNKQQKQQSQQKKQDHQNQENQDQQQASNQEKKNESQQQVSDQEQKANQQAQQDQKSENQGQQDQKSQQDQNRQASSQEQRDQSGAQRDENASNDAKTPQQTAASQELSPDEAERLLNAIRDRAREAEDQRQQRQRARLRDNRVDKDW